MNLQKLIFTENACYKAGRKITVKGIIRLRNNAQY